MNTKVEEAFKALDEMHDTLQSAGSYSGEGYYFHNGQAELEAKDYTAARTTLAAHIAQQDATIARLTHVLAKLVAADNEYESARRDWDNAIADPESLTTGQWERVASRFESAVVSRAAALNQE